MPHTFLFITTENSKNIKRSGCYIIPKGVYSINKILRIFYKVTSRTLRF